MEYTILNEKMLLDEALKIQEGTIQPGNEKSYKKLMVKREDAVAVLIFNTDSEEFILTRQFRYPISSAVKEQIIEVVAGKIDEGESAMETAIREVEEEVGYKITETTTHLLASCFASPGYSSECFHIFFATVTNADKITKGGGLEEENEHIETVQMSMHEFKEMISNGTIQDAKTYLAGLLAKDKFIQW
jgi:nudix-type nucleoside diphosphatase (YffH/AdpP family)